MKIDIIPNVKLDDKRDKNGRKMWGSSQVEESSLIDGIADQIRKRKFVDNNGNMSYNDL
jgi:hypothetical protein